MFAALGIAAAGKLKSPLVPMVIFTSAICFTSFPAYLEGFREIRNDADKKIDESGMMRRFGIYCLLGGYGLLFYKRRNSIPFLMPKMKNLL